MRLQGRFARSSVALLATVVLLALLAGCASGRKAATTSPAEIPPPGPVAVGPEGYEDPFAAGAEASEDSATSVEELTGEEPFLDLAVSELDLFPEDDLVSDEELTESPHDDLATTTPELTPEEAERELELVRAQPPTFDIPIVTNKQVLGWVDHYAHRAPDRFRPGLERSGRYVPMFRRIFEEHGLPQDLVYMAHVESAYKTTAYSRAHAKGIFQFIRATGRRYGLRIDYWVDERSDPEKAAHAAADYLTDLYDEFGDWYLALAGYNAGEGKIRRALARTPNKDFWSIARTRYIRRETKNYVPAILAATLISKEPAKYGFDFEPAEPIEYETVQVSGAADLRVLAKCAGTTPDALKSLNPALRRAQTPPATTTDVRVPVGTGETMLAALAEIPANERVLYTRHLVRRGDTLSTIARRYGVSVYGIQQANGMGRSTMIRAGRTLQIPSGARVPYPEYAAATGTGDRLTYRVRRGDYLFKIAKRYDTTPRSIAAASGIGVHDTLRVGQRLTIVPGRRSAGSSSARTSGGGATGDVLTHRVRRGDTLWEIARQYRTTTGAIAAINGISVNGTLSVGRRLKVVRGARSAAQAKQAIESPAVASASEVHTVRRGDSLWRIASLYRTTIDALCNLNNISRHAKLYPGTKLKVRAN